MNRRVLRARVVALAVLLATAATAAVATPAAQAVTTRKVKVESRNLYLGVDLRRAAVTSSREDFEATVRQLFGEVQATDPSGRMKLVAAELAKVNPDLVGLQEVTLWQLGSTKIDYLALLQRHLRARGLNYRVVAPKNEADARFTMATGEAARFRVANAILVKRDVKTANVRTGVFKSQITFPTAIGTFKVARNWESLDANVRGARFHFIHTHLEAYSAPQRNDQANELVRGPLRHRGPVILVADVNAGTNAPKPEDRPAFQTIRAAGYVVRQTSGFTCCRNDDLKTGVLNYTIDFVMTKPRLPLVASGLVGVTAKTGVGTYAGDHPGVWSTLRVPA